jgi:NAD(P)-dependent dehydrogenase (short-subunit alcohol dehydrogenase family)
LFGYLQRITAKALTAQGNIMSRTPMKRLGEPSEITDNVAYLSSGATSYIMGEILVWTNDGELHGVGLTACGCDGGKLHERFTRNKSLILTIKLHKANSYETFSA